MNKHINNFVLCIGTQKAGTTWLYQNLADIETINTSYLKELDFFNYKFIPEQRNWIQKSLLNRNLRIIEDKYSQTSVFDKDELNLLLSSLNKILKGELDEQWYFDQFAIDMKATHKINLDVTPEYIMLPESGIKYLFNLLQMPKIIIMLRSPVDRTLSHIRMIINNDRSGICDENELISFLNDPQVNIRSRYDLLLPIWESLVPKEKIKYIIYEDLKIYPERILNEVNEFMGLDTRLEWPLAHTIIHAGADCKLPQNFIEQVKNYYEDTIKWCKLKFPDTSITNW
jgi:hypothetical protein